MEQQQPPLWSNLPDVCLLLVFKKLPASDMAFSVGQVCANWARVQRDELRRQHLWSCLPGVCLLAMFKYIPMDDMIRSVGRVCTNWGRVQRVELRRRHVLVIADKELEVVDHDNPYGSKLIAKVLRDDGSPWAPARTDEQINLDTLLMPVKDLHETITTPLMNILPNITHLTLEIYIQDHWAASILEQLTRLINHYATSLVLLRLDGFRIRGHSLSQRHSARNAIMGPLFDSINRLESLQHLTLNIPTLDTYPELSILSRLATVAYVQTYTGPSLLASLCRYPTRDDLRVEFGTPVELDELFRLDRHQAAKFVRSYISWNSTDETVVELDEVCESQFEEMHKFCSLFVSLHTLEIIDCPMPMTMMARALSLLPQLVHLKMQSVQIPPNEQTAQIEIVPVPSVRLLTLLIFTPSHHDTERLHLHQIFPNLQVLHLTHRSDECVDCDYGPLGPEAIVRVRANCIHLARQPFRQCARLHTVELDTMHNLNDLIPEGLITRNDSRNLEI